jgi:DNA-3-methyladenine glycosylase I
MVKNRRCSWCGDDPLYVEYHDREWGVPEFAGQALFERLVLEGMQAGLSWYTVLKKRERMREQFFEFDPGLLAERGETRMDVWLQDAGLIRHRGKLNSVIANARAYQEIADFPEMIWSFVDGQPRQNRWRSLADIPAQTIESKAMARALKKAGFKFVGPTTCYAFMQSAGLVNDHLLNCPAYSQCQELGHRHGGADGGARDDR